ncbi:MAG: enoyl-CoA hydratase [Zetaproteobacteria bacterium CG06_land_8_20_14_3_00_59_53]|nr:MAG: enoyl-CoA hydratase [Zetaproteobacteria bacterium CG2_30_59_37]PIO89685.1 MAG: enoyl-CoA hydratase [Zetaproteobacteria bacterium CG23_combo_of_CG06-09_8_20_14_all_59_86]PIQ65754.1 MAG: enoyl-CoA hydratase [Zetaproteobacteria bacterium CG11_big_fil_rev_8_21_14_0_20_59_439]PIU70095.1 MAG: enoyl-CoA hydratase [Zetaproteobacteria bacterium CG06_land_8_20_14_3_00_59_53]PIU96576.1 MAG: enoyl-CoA hydratase [Zetaproteobacteria bacterium CG03_land_8_20_14_0_80_59_51]PIY46094.1 MAG: enoyl-CoA hy
MNTVRSLKTDEVRPYTQIKIEHDTGHAMAWLYMNARPRPCFSSELTHEIQDWYAKVCNGTAEHAGDIRYVASTSNLPQVYNLGGDMELFCDMIERQDREGLLEYATACNDILYSNHIGINGNITTIAVVQGDALGGGFEGAVSSEVVIAERSAKMGLPDILFNLFPGAGAYSVLSRKIGAVQAERIILSGRLYSGEEMHALGVVDILAEDGCGREAAYEYIAKEEKMRNGVRAFRAAKRCTNPLTFDELLAAANIWVDAAMRLGGRDIRMMQRLVKRQLSRSA